MVKIKQTDYCYLAGYLDGDGCFFIGRERPKKHLKQKNIVSIVISSVNKHVLDCFKNQFGGSVSLTKKEHDNNKSLYQYSSKKRNTLKIIECIKPYIVEKSEECNLVLQFAHSSCDAEQKAFIHKMKITKDIGNLISKYHKKEFEHSKNIIIPDKNDFAYLAGFIDAECNFGIQKYKPKNKPNHVYKIILQCNNTKAPVFKWLLERFGGQIHFIDRRNHGKARKNQLTWRLCGKALSKILNSIYPFLKHKKPVCEELMKFYNTTLPNGGARHTAIFRSQYEKVLKIREEIVVRVHKLNLKGTKSM
ncbi:MAG: 2 protein [Candidatus Poribacteria bacterium]|nr:2 protein [Candidatus Poribacteria bacterium]